jgi:hypothetical protein
MGQKSNVLTLRKSEVNLNLYRNNSLEFLYGYTFLKLIEKMFSNHKIFLTKFILNFVENKIFINFVLFFNVVKTLKMKKKSTRLKFNQTSPRVLFFLKNKFCSLILKQLKILNKNLIVFCFTSINFFLKKKKDLIIIIFRNFKRYVNALFPRRFRFFLDFVKLSLLFSIGKINSNFYIKILTEIFRILQKKRHARFFQFIKKFFIFLIQIKDSNLKGFKLSIVGNLKGKRRGSKKSITFGQFPLQSLNKKIEFAKSHAFTVYGTFGLKIWVYRSK